jgi:peroxin-3
MLTSFKTYVYDRRKGFAKLAGAVGGAYLAGQYAVKRLEEVRENLVQDRTAKEK